METFPRWGRMAAKRDTCGFPCQRPLLEGSRRQTPLTCGGGSLTPGALPSRPWLARVASNRHHTCSSQTGGKKDGMAGALQVPHDPMSPFSKSGTVGNA